VTVRLITAINRLRFARLRITHVALKVPVVTTSRTVFPATHAARSTQQDITLGGAIPTGMLVLQTCEIHQPNFSTENMKPTYRTKFAVPPAVHELEAIEAAWTKRRDALRRRRASKLIKYLPTVRLCLSRKHSPAEICEVLATSHGLSVSRTAVWRFIEANPLLRTFANTDNTHGGTDSNSNHP
jgi:hypothetical protein